MRTCPVTNAPAKNNPYHLIVTGPAEKITGDISQTK
jgi:hypothetical protein